MRSTRGNEQDGTSRSAAFTRALDQRDIPYTLEAGGSVFARPHVAMLRDAMEILRKGSPDRSTVLGFADERIAPLFPHVQARELTNLCARWGRDIHTPIAVERRRVRPQRLLHELLAACGAARTELDEGVMADIGVLSCMLQDVETVYVSIDTVQRFGDILNFMRNIAESGYQSATDAAVRRPDAVTVSTVHKAKGLEYPDGWLPRDMIADAVAYGDTREQEARLFYTGMTRAERYLYVTHARQLPKGKIDRKESPFSARLIDHGEVREAPPADALPPNDLPPAEPRRRVDEAVLPTTFSEIRYYLRCPRDYKYRHVWGFSPPIPDMFGFGQTVHAAVGKLHERYEDRAPTASEAEEIAHDTFHVKHVPQSRDPEERPGAYERGREAATEIVRGYAEDYASDFERRRQLEIRFEIPLRYSVLGGSIDLLLHLDELVVVRRVGAALHRLEVDHARVKDRPAVDWTELALQVQLYARAATDVLDANARTGAVHLLKDGQRVEVPVGDAAVDSAVRNVEWAAERIIAGDFPMRPHAVKCDECDWKDICPQVAEEFGTDETPPPLHLPGEQRMARVFSEADG